MAVVALKLYTGTSGSVKGAEGISNALTAFVKATSNRPRAKASSHKVSMEGLRKIQHLSPT